METESLEFILQKNVLIKDFIPDKYFYLVNSFHNFLVYWS